MTIEDKLPNPTPLHVRYLLGLSGDATQSEVEDQWDQVVVPLLNTGPKFLLNEMKVAAMRGGLTADQAHRVISQTPRGKLLNNSIERDARWRLRREQSTPPFTRASAPASKQTSSAKKTPAK